jgi:CDP-diacylglycerol--glycerol-3-phosphate 3-phosphatidyltransferase
VTNGWHWLPNGLVVLRCLAGLALPWAPSDWQFTVLFLAGLSDLIDGPLSRWLGATSRFGQIGDPIADKTLIMAAIVCAVRANWLSWTELLALAARDLTVLGLSGLALAYDRRNWRKLTPRLSGKMATAGQLVALLSVYWTQHPQPMLVGIAAGISIFAALDYAWKAVSVQAQSRP